MAFSKEDVLKALGDLGVQIPDGFAAQLSDTPATVPDVPGGNTPDVVKPANPLVDTPVVASPSDDISEMRAQIASLTSQLKAQQTTQVHPNTIGIGVKDPAITISQIEPGVKWAIAQGLVKAEDIGEHIVNLLK